MADDAQITFNFDLPDPDDSGRSGPDPSPSSPSEPKPSPADRSEVVDSLDDLNATLQELSDSGAFEPSAQDEFLRDLERANNSLRETVETSSEQNTAFVEALDEVTASLEDASGFWREAASNTAANPLAEALDRLGTGAADVRPESNLAQVLESIDSTNDNLTDAIEELNKSLKTLEQGSRTTTVTTNRRRDETRIGSFVRRLVRPLAQASFTPTLFRNNLERGGLGGLRSAADLLFNPGRATRAVRGTARGLGGVGRGVGSPAVRAFAAGLGKAAPAVATATAAFIGVPAAIALFSTSVVAGAKAIDATTRQLAADIAAFSPEVQQAQAFRDLESIFSRQEQADRIGPEVASLLTEGQDVNNELRRLVGNILLWLDGPALGVLNLAESILQGVNGLLELFGSSSSDINDIARAIRKEQNRRFTEEARKSGIGRFALELGAQVDESFAATRERILREGAAAAGGSL